MALKRINKELTDLGRYVRFSAKARLARMTACDCGAPCRGYGDMASQHHPLACLLTFYTVTLPRRAQLAPSEMTWYVTYCDTPAAEAVPPTSRGEEPRRASMLTAR
jgi:hypothetical protein